MDTTNKRIPMEELPESIQELLNSEQFIENIERIAEKNGMRPEEYGPLLRTTVRLLRGEIPATAYVAELIDVTGIPREKVALIAQEINRDVFNPVKDALKELHTTPQKSATPPVGTVAAPIAAPPTPATPVVSNIFEQKLGGAFRMPSSATSAAPPAPSSPTQIIPPAPQALTPKEDPYREAAV